MFYLSFGPRKLLISHTLSFACPESDSAEWRDGDPYFELYAEYLTLRSAINAWIIKVMQLGYD